MHACTIESKAPCGATTEFCGRNRAEYLAIGYHGFDIVHFAPLFQETALNLHFLSGFGVLTFLLLLNASSAPAANMPKSHPKDRPFIWAREDDKKALLEKIQTQPWAKSVFDAMAARAKTGIDAHQADRDAYLRGLPIKWDDKEPAFKTTREIKDRWDILGPTRARFNAALDAAIIYFLTGDETSAQFAADVLHNAAKAYGPLKAGNAFNGGLLVHNDLLYEARVTSTQLPLIYDFLHDWLRENKVYDVKQGKEVDFDFDAAQACFRKLIQTVCSKGSKNNNWSALMATTQLNNLLALDDLKERTRELEIYLIKSTNNQASMQYDYRHFQKPGDIGHESLQYAIAPASIRTQHMIVLERIYPDLKLFETYPNFLKALWRRAYLRYPNGQEILFGDGKRGGRGEGAAIPVVYAELIYGHAKARGLDELAEPYGGVIQKTIQDGKYDRSEARAYHRLGSTLAPLQILVQAPEISEDPAPPLELPRTDTLPFAGIALQRNLSPTGDPDYGLMGFVGGGGFIHGHASGMNMELYGMGDVLGAKSGRSSYSAPVHKNYYRLFAAHNTVIVNGASQGQGGWQGIKIETVEVEAMEPPRLQPAVSENFSFTCSSFKDNRGKHADARQQRTLAIVRTSPTSGFYVDLFRSVSKVTNRSAATLAGPFTDQYHDYIYRNIGALEALESQGEALTMEPQPARFQNDVGDRWKQPGWRYFENTVVSPPFDTAFRARYLATPEGRQPVAMDVFLPAGIEREVAKVDAPPITEAPTPYAKKPAETLVIRKIGEAWDQPFLAVFEPHFASEESHITGAEHLLDEGQVVGVKVNCTVKGTEQTYFVISLPKPDQRFTDKAAGLSFRGRFGIVADRGDDSLELYIGEGTLLEYKGRSVRAVNNKTTSASAVFARNAEPLVNSADPVSAK